MTSTVTTASTTTYPHKVLTPLTAKPTPHTLGLLRQQVYANATAAKTSLFGGQNGHLGLVMPDAQYTQRAGVAFQAPAAPGEQAAPAANATQAQILEANRAYNVSVAHFNKYDTTNADLKAQIIEAVPDIYLSPLRDPLMGYTDVSPRDMLEYLDTHHGTIEARHIEENRKTLTEKWNVDEPIDVLWTRITTAQAFATRAQEPIGDPAAIRLTLQTIEATGLFTLAAGQWRQKPDADQTMDNFRAHFIRANTERMLQATARSAGYTGSANNAHTPTQNAARLLLPPLPAPPDDVHPHQQ